MMLTISIVSSTTGGTPGKTDAYDRETTIGRIQQVIEAVVSEHVPAGQLSTVKTRIRKPKLPADVRATTIEFRIARGTVFDMDRGRVIRACQAEVPAAVTANIPADHLCSLVVGLKDEDSRVSN